MPSNVLDTAMTLYKQKPTPSVWITWLAKMMADELQCHWAVWFRSHCTYEKLPSNFDSASWIARHRTLLDERVASLEREGCSVSVEGENWFEVPGRQYAITVAGKPDIIAVQGDRAWVEDCKTGKPKNSDLYQVLLYMLLVPVGVERCRGMTLEGRLVYSDSVIDISVSQVNEEFRVQLKGAIRALNRQANATINSSEHPRKVPAFRECRYCDIPHHCCSERIDTRPNSGSENHSLF